MHMMGDYWVEKQCRKNTPIRVWFELWAFYPLSYIDAIAVRMLVKGISDSKHWKGAINPHMNVE